MGPYARWGALLAGAIVVMGCGSTSSGENGTSSRVDDSSVLKKPPKEPMKIPEVREFQPSILWNGRFAALDVQPKDVRDVIAAADSGGLFRTKDGGSSWHHVDTFRPPRMFDFKQPPHPFCLLLPPPPPHAQPLN